jgi:hypothetical protein
METKL